MTVTSHTMSSVAHTAGSSTECLLVSLHNASRLFWLRRLFAGCCLQKSQANCENQSSATPETQPCSAGAT